MLSRDESPIPFLERDGAYRGNPADSAQAIAELERLRGQGATYLVLRSSAYWWLDYYEEFAAYLDSAFSRVFVSNNLIVWALVSAPCPTLFPITPTDYACDGTNATHEAREYRHQQLQLQTLSRRGDRKLAESDLLEYGSDRRRRRVDRRFRRPARQVAWPDHRYREGEWRTGLRLQRGLRREQRRGSAVSWIQIRKPLAPTAIARAMPHFEDPDVVKVHWQLAIASAYGTPTGGLYPSGRPAHGDLRFHVCDLGPSSVISTPAGAYARTFLDQVFPIPEDLYRMGADALLFQLAPFYGRLTFVPEPQSLSSAWRQLITLLRTFA